MDFESAHCLRPLPHLQILGIFAEMNLIARRQVDVESESLVMSLSQPVGNPRPRWMLFAVCSLLVAAVAVLRVAGFPSATASQTALFTADPAHLLHAAHLVQQGDAPYKDFFWHYGWTSLYGIAYFTGLTNGVSAESWFLHDQVWGVVVALLTLLIMLRAAGRLWGTVAWLLTGFGWSFSSGLDGGSYFYYERATLLGIALLWSPPQRRSNWAIAAIGIFLGVLQTIKFGSAFNAGFSLVLLDLWWMTSTRRMRQEFALWFRQILSLALVFAAFQTCIILYAVQTLGAPLAKETLFPAYHMDWYASYMANTGFAARWPSWINLNYFLGTQLPQLLAFATLLALLIVFPKRHVQTVTSVYDGLWRGAAAPIYLGLFFVTGLIAFFKHANTIAAYSYLLVPLLASMFRFLPNNFCRSVAALLLLPAALVLPSGIYKSFSAKEGRGSMAIEAFSMPNGQTLFMPLEEGNAISGVLARLRSIDTDPDTAKQHGFLILGADGWMGSALHFYGQLPLACRHSMVFPRFVRDYEADTVLRQVLNAKAVVIQLTEEKWNAATNSPREQWKEMLEVFSDSAQQASFLESLGTPEVHPQRWLIFPVAKTMTPGNTEP